jgi:hypothetical protein
MAFASLTFSGSRACCVPAAHTDANCDGALDVRELDTFDARLASLLASLRAVGSWSAGEVVRDMTLALVHQPSIRASFSG